MKDLLIYVVPLLLFLIGLIYGLSKRKKPPVEYVLYNLKDKHCKDCLFWGRITDASGKTRDHGACLNEKIKLTGIPGNNELSASLTEGSLGSIETHEDFMCSNFHPSPYQNHEGLYHP